MQTSRSSRRTWEMGRTGSRIREEKIDWNDDRSSGWGHQDSRTRSPCCDWVETSSYHEPCTPDHVRAGSKRYPSLHWSPPKSIRIQNRCDKEHLRCDGGGQLWQRREERQERRSTSEPESESKQGRCLLALRWKRTLEHRMLVESKESVRFRWNPKQRRQRKTEERHRQRSGHIGTGRPSCSADNHSRNPLLRAL